MKVIINNQPKDTNASSLQELVSELALPGQGVAVAVNNEMIPKDNWAAHKIKDGDDILIIQAACGG